MAKGKRSRSTSRSRKSGASKRPKRSWSRTTKAAVGVTGAVAALGGGVAGLKWLYDRSRKPTQATARPVPAPVPVPVRDAIFDMIKIAVAFSRSVRMADHDTVSDMLTKVARSTTDPVEAGKLARSLLSAVEPGDLNTLVDATTRACELFNLTWKTGAYTKFPSVSQPGRTEYYVPGTRVAVTVPELKKYNTNRRNAAEKILTNRFDPAWNKEYPEELRAYWGPVRASNYVL